MEPVSFAVGVVGLAGLFSTCLDVIEKARLYRDFGSEHFLLTTKYEADKALFKSWAQRASIDKLESEEHQNLRLYKPEIAIIVERILMCIEDIFTLPEGDVSKIQLISERSANGFFEVDTALDELHGTRSGVRKTIGSKRQRLKWAFGGKVKFVERAQMFSEMVSRLDKLVPPKDRNSFTNEETQRRTDIIWAEIWKQTEVALRKDIDAWLDAKWANVRYDQCLEKQLGGTCDWIIDVPVFQQWSSPEFESDIARLIWIHGPAGYGKTITCARVIKHLLLTLEAPVGYYFYTDDNSAEQDPFIIMRSWISQMIASSRPAFELAVSSFESKKGPLASRKEAVELFRLIVQAVPFCTFVVDGLDECVHPDNNSTVSSDNSRSAFLQTLKSAVAKTTSRVMVMSRDESDIRNGVYTEISEEDHLIIYEHRITKEDVQQDLSHFCKSTIKEKFSTKTPAQREELSRQLIESSHGMFLWVQLQTSNLVKRGKGKNNKQLVKMIEETPQGLYRLYERNWDEIERLVEPDRSRALAILRWAAFGIRPLTVREITEAVLVIDEDDCDDILGDDLPDALDKAYIDGQIIELCASLVEIRQASDMTSVDDKTIHLMHASVKDITN